MKKIKRIFYVCFLALFMVMLGSCGEEEHVHNYIKEVIDPTCEEQGYTINTCECGDVFNDAYIDALGHDIQTHEKLDATCEEQGYYSYETCSRCEYNTYKEISALGHTIVVDPALEATCESTGLTEGKHCGTCGETIIAQNEIPISHKYVNGLCVDCDRDANGNILKYKKLNDDTYEITGFVELKTSHIAIPTKYKGTHVTRIGASAFANCNSLTSITIPSSVTSIGESIFDGCNSLTSISVDKNNEVFDSRNNCNAIIEIATNTLIVGCKNTIMPNTVRNIGSSAFRGCSGLTSIEIPESVKKIGYGAFYGCSSLTSITLPFVGATLNGTSDTHFGYIFGASSYSYNNTYVPTSLKKVIITGGTTIDSDAFSNCSNLTSIEIPNSVTSIGEFAISGCRSLTSIEIPNSVTGIGEGAFRNCSNLTSIEIPNSVTSIGTRAFEGCSSLTSITIPFVGNELNETGYPQFGHIFFEPSRGSNSRSIPSSLKKVIITGGTCIQEGAFADCLYIQSIVIPISITSIGDSAFYNCPRLRQVYYTGTQAQWQNIYIGPYNSPLTSAAKTYNYRVE